MVNHQIRAGITVYEFQDGVEINRRPAFPRSVRIVAERRRQLAVAMQALAINVRNIGESFAAAFRPVLTSAAEQFRVLAERIAKVHP